MECVQIRDNGWLEYAAKAVFNVFKHKGADLAGNEPRLYGHCDPSWRLHWLLSHTRLLALNDKESSAPDI